MENTEETTTETQVESEATNDGNNDSAVDDEQTTTETEEVEAAPVAVEGSGSGWGNTEIPPEPIITEAELARLEEEPDYDADLKMLIVCSLIKIPPPYRTNPLNAGPALSWILSKPEDKREAALNVFVAMCESKQDQKAMSGTGWHPLADTFMQSIETATTNNLFGKKVAGGLSALALGTEYAQRVKGGVKPVQRPIEERMTDFDEMDALAKEDASQTQVVNEAQPAAAYQAPAYLKIEDDEETMTDF